MQCVSIFSISLSSYINDFKSPCPTISFIYVYNLIKLLGEMLTARQNRVDSKT